MPKKATVPPLEQLVTQVKITNSLLAAQLLQHMTQQEVIGLLKGVGASMNDIADILGTSYASVAVAASRLRKKSLQKGSHDGEEEKADSTTETSVREEGDGGEQPE